MARATIGVSITVTPATTRVLPLMAGLAIGDMVISFP